MAILSARRAVVSRWVIQITVLTRSPDGRRDTSSIVSNISFWACASSADVYMGYTRSGTRFSKIKADRSQLGWGWGRNERKRGGEGDGSGGVGEECRWDECIAVRKGVTHRLVEHEEIHLRPLCPHKRSRDRDPLPLHVQETAASQHPPSLL